jgi:hypothetical protein
MPDVLSKVAMKLTHKGLLIVVWVITANAAIAEPQPESRERFVCTFGSSHRFIDIYRLAAGGPRRGGCRVDYTRDGVTRRLWSASGDYAYCVKRAVGLVTTLSRGNFSCRPQTAEPSAGSGAPPP